MDTQLKIEKAQTVLDAGGNVIRTRDDRELILVDKDGKVQNTDACGWLPDTSEVNNTVFRSRIEPWIPSLFQSGHLPLPCSSGITNVV